MHAAEPLPHFVDDYLSFLYEVHPTGATMDGVHVHDDLIEDYRRSAIDTHVSALAGFGRRLDSIPVDQLPHARADRASDRFVEHPRPPVRARSGAVVGAQPARLRRHAGVEPRGAGDLHLRAGDRSRPPRAVEAAPGAAARAGRARQHQGAAGDLRQGRHRHLARRDVVHRRRSAARVRQRRRHAPARRSRTMRAAKRCRRLAPTSPISRTTSGRKPRARSASAAIASSRSCGSRKASRCRSIACWRSRRASLRRRRKNSGRLAGRLNGGDPIAAWRKAKQKHPAAGTLIRTAREQLDELHTFLSRYPVMSMPESGSITVAPTPEFFRWSSASMWTPGPFESKPSRAMYYLTDVDPKWEDDRKSEHLLDFNLPTLWAISDPRGLPGPLPALPVPEEGGLEGPAVDDVRAGVLHRRLGALLRADDDRGRLRPRRSTRSSSVSSPKPWSAWPASSSASACTPRTGRWSRACGFSWMKRFSRNRARAAKPSEARSIRHTWCIRQGS